MTEPTTVRVLPAIDIPLERACPGCGRDVGNGHRPTCEFVQDFQRVFAAATGLNPTPRITVDRWAELTGGVA